MNNTAPLLVSCIMPTYNRRRFVPQAIRYFLRQEYAHKELIIIDDGTDAVKDLIPDTPSVKYYRLDYKISLGAKLNLACEYALGSIIANWDDDDWYAPRRLAYQVNTLLTEGKDLCGINQLLYYDLRNGDAYQYVYPPDQRTWLLGSSLCYKKELWNEHPFADVNVGMDGLFVWATPPDRVKVLSDSSIAVHMIHDNNVSPKKTDGGWWHSYPTETIRTIIDGDWVCYHNQNDEAAHLKINGHPIQERLIHTPAKTIKNVYACLVHEDENCIIDLVRNLHYHDRASVILLYNGGENTNLFKSQFPYNRFGAIIHPKPCPVKHGYLHPFALDCMQFALENLSFDTFTCVDSDQLLIRSGYREYVGAFLSSASDIGMFSNKPKRISTDDATDSDVWPAIQAFQEYDLWKPFLKQFPKGESQFVHWTFWPSSVFMADAVRDLIKLFKENKQLQEIMTKTTIWATEEVILPTLVKLMGYDIVANPCSYDFVKYKKSYTLQDAACAFNKTDAYWIHPVERKYEHPLRKYIREHNNHYFIESKKEHCEDDSSSALVLALSLIEQIKKIEGWLTDHEADLLIAITGKALKELQPFYAIVEIGSYHGKSTILFGNIIKALGIDAKVYAIDPHDGKLGAVDQGLESVPSSLESFNRNIQNAGIAELVEPIKEYSYDVEWKQPISLLFIDGLHDYPSVAKDFWHFEAWIVSRGYVAFHDYAHYFPGVIAFVDELLHTGTYQKIKQAESLIVLQKR
ncbi:glycosyltransferase [Ilyomonas limi]|uniref:Glycosyltransferase n=1 Tax=Ilyomonas limi TaxID=2575867 RepID=A0A4U3L3X1_9BACT|nr:glycosyltransferase [Ilyomonas limi]TKK69871.1 glycosyltransferase [Ilyomonas limi]